MNAVVVVASGDGSFPRRRGRPPGSAGHQPERFKSQLASLVVLGKRNIEIAMVLGVSSKTVGLWLRHPAVQAEIRELEAELRQRTQMQFAALFPVTIKAMRKLLRADDPQIVLNAIEMVWISLGRLPPKGARTNCNRTTAVSPHRWQRGLILQPPPLDREQYAEAVRLIRAERERMERNDVGGPVNPPQGGL